MKLIFIMLLILFAGALTAQTWLLKPAEPARPVQPVQIWEQRQVPRWDAPSLLTREKHKRDVILSLPPCPPHQPKQHGCY